MNDITSVVTLTEGADSIYRKALRLKDLAMRYQNACTQHDMLAKYMLGEVESVSVMLTGKQANARQQTQRTFQMESRDFETGLQPLIDRHKANCVALYEEIQKLAGEI